MIMEAEITKIIDNLAISLILGILGIAITVFTVVYSFMESTKERKRSISDRIRISTEDDPVMASDLQFAIKRLKDLKWMNYVVIIIIILDIVTFCIYATHMIYNSECWLKITAVSLLGILIILCFVTLLMYLLQYHNRFNEI